jgi:Domain of unknown function (DUF5615)
VRLLLDHCVPASLQRALAAHDVKTTAQLGWEQLDNGDLLAAAAQQFDVFITVDKNVETQQNLAALPLSIIVLDVPRNTPETVLPLAPSIENALLDIQPRRFIKIPPAGSAASKPPPEGQF